MPTGKEPVYKISRMSHWTRFWKEAGSYQADFGGTPCKVLKCSSLFAYRSDYCRFCSFNRCISCIDAWATQLRIIQIQCQTCMGVIILVQLLHHPSNSMLSVPNCKGQLLSHPVKSLQCNLLQPTARDWSSWTLETHPRWEDHFALPITTADPKEVRGTPPGMLRCVWVQLVWTQGGRIWFLEWYIYIYTNGNMGIPRKLEMACLGESMSTQNLSFAKPEAKEMGPFIL